MMIIDDHANANDHDYNEAYSAHLKSVFPAEATEIMRNNPA